MKPQQAVTYRSRWRFRIEQWRRRIVPWLLEDQADQGLGGPPNNWRSTGPIIIEQGEKYGRPHRSEVYARFGNDAHEIMIGQSWIDGDHREDTWYASVPAPAFRRIALWYLWRWAWGEWFGLRRRLFYWHLFRKVAKLQAWRAARPRQSMEDEY
jgi:hypothetical protein